jgi:hypothetical protein
VQGDRCVPVRPIAGSEPVASFYDYGVSEEYVSTSTADSDEEHTEGSVPFASLGTRALQRDRTSVAFLYRGPERLSLVVVHGRVGSESGGSATLHLSGLPADGEWLVKDDLYRNSTTGERGATNRDTWNVEGTDHRIDWTWETGRADGGVFGGLGDDFEVTVDPAFNEAAALYDEYYEGTITDWEFLSGPDGRDRIALETDAAIEISTDRCP